MGIPISNLADLNGSDGFRIEGVDEYGGVVVSNAGDLNGDGFDDVVVDSPSLVDFFGSAYVVFGKTSGFDATFDVRTLDGSNGFHSRGDRDRRAAVSGGRMSMAMGLKI